VAKRFLLNRAENYSREGLASSGNADREQSLTAHQSGVRPGCGGRGKTAVPAAVCLGRCGDLLVAGLGQQRSAGQAD
jgi:hypothetical protein